MGPDAWLGLILACIASFAAVAVIIPTFRAAGPARVARRIEAFRKRYGHLRENQTRLGFSVLHSRPSDVSYNEIPLLTKPNWILAAPISLEHLTVRLLNSANLPNIMPQRVRGLSLAGPMGYSEALQMINPNAPYFNGTIYRPVRIESRDGALEIDFVTGKYFDYLDTSEVFAFAASLNERSYLRRQRNRHDSFALERRVASLGVLTLTVVLYETGPEMFLHKRSGTFAVGDALYHVVPAGEFAPSDISLAAIRDDFSLWRNVMREYAEEYCGLSDAQGTGGRRLDYRQSSPFQELALARTQGKLHLSCLGVGLDPLTLKPELITVAVFDGPCFDAIFPRPFPKTDEGVILEDVPFSLESVADYVAHPGVRFGAKACLKLAWDHRIELGIVEPAVD